MRGEMGVRPGKGVERHAKLVHRIRVGNSGEIEEHVGAPWARPGFKTVTVRPGTETHMGQLFAPHN
jgi:hypothetical protein